MEETTDPFKEAIVNHLQELANNDALFAITFSKPYKNIDDCATYILNEVKKSQRQGFDDDEIFNMAIHYYDEETVEIGRQRHCSARDHPESRGQGNEGLDHTQQRHGLT